MTTGDSRAARFQQLLQKLAGPQPDQHAIESSQRAVGDFEAEDVQQQAEVSSGVAGQAPLIPFPASA